MINSLSNERVKKWAKLNDKKFQEQGKKFLVEGEHLVDEAFRSGYLLEVIALEGKEYPYDNINYVSAEVMGKISTLSNHPQIIGVASMIEPDEIQGDVIVLDRISDPGNLGTIIRSAVAFGIDTVVLGRGTVSLYNPKVVRATEGLMFHLNIVEADLKTELVELKNRGYTVYTTDVFKGKAINAEDFTGLVAIVVGNEGSGVSEEVKNLCDASLHIDMKRSCESLNVGVATSIILYELAKKKGIGD